jgi:hypothetical protein
MRTDPEFMKWKREAGERWYEQVKDLNQDELMAFYVEQNREAREYLERIRAKQQQAKAS